VAASRGVPLAVSSAGAVLLAGAAEEAASWGVPLAARLQAEGAEEGAGASLAD
jgi:hypothetical protein